MSDAQAPAKKSSRTLVLALVAVLLLAGGGGGAWFYMHKQAAGEDGEQEAKVEKKHAAKPLFTTLEPFTVNLSDPRGDRFAQVGVTLQFEDPHVEADVKDRLPAIRNEILLLISSKQIEELLSLEGKQRLAAEIRLLTGRALGAELPDLAPKAEAAAASHSAPEDDEDEPKPKKKGKRKKAPEVVNPITQVLFSQFIVQ